eukprot:984914-Pleurochrysis_carterae.AAC.2
MQQYASCSIKPSNQVSDSSSAYSLCLHRVKDWLRELGAACDVCSGQGYHDLETNFIDLASMFV